MTDNRRKFLKTLSIGAAGALATPTQIWGQATTPLRSALTDLQSDDISETYWKTIQSQFHFAEGLTYFNNGSLGACPKPIRQATINFQNTLDDFPSKYMWGGWKDEIEEVRQKTADLFSVSEEEIALIHNTTEGMNLIASSMDLQPGDEIISADHEHTSALNPWKYWQQSKGVKIVTPTLPILPKSVEEVVDVYRKAITSKTRVISICHLVNTNGMILPIKEVTELAHEKGILVAVDGAQGTGMFNIDLKDIGCDFYTVSAHKWLFSPKGVGVFYARQDSQKHLKPLIVARGYEDTSIRRLENYNTRNLPEVLGLGAALDYRNAIGAQKIHDRTYELKHYFRDKIKDNEKLVLKTPELDSLSAGIQVVEVLGKNVQEVKNRLFDEYGIDSRPMSKFGLNAVRLSFAIFITKNQIDTLINALETISE
ncbi:aminotransferase class V-fold PLP-dependent enzyme [Maribacter algarum]|uniref:Aminotransferase class V-fold PLP-dependent enzyme n=1 Tax=Maribacter algarum (ex Zhang et al. 2020) TaxID=2578118 RepID=A0A5S3PND3_9FLAO|nr:aminotransferase class V-fold PLP-dependent enzyme [Maribacter algarum]TMM55936.1 aminotransferase class V-fold PLP-dependent enzyme [Maribacter algarum]